MGTLKKNILLKSKHVVLDINVIVDFWLGIGSEEITEQLFDLASDGLVQVWISASSIPTIEYVAKRSFKQRGVPPEEAGRLVSGLIDNLFETAGILTNYGFEQKHAYQAARDFEDAQIAITLRTLGGASVCVVSEDASFDALGEFAVYTPSEALNWLRNEDSVHDGPTFIDAAEQQLLILPDIEKRVTAVLRHGRLTGPQIESVVSFIAKVIENC